MTQRTAGGLRRAGAATVALTVHLTIGPSVHLTIGPSDHLSAQQSKRPFALDDLARIQDVSEYHGIDRPSFVRDRLERYVAWYDRFLKGDGRSADELVGESVPTSRR